MATSAVDLVEESGLAALTMRGLASRLGVEAMSIYHYYPSRDALLDAMVEEWMDAAAPAELLASAGLPDWRGRMAGLAEAVRRAALTHPRTFPLVVDHGTDDPIYHPPLRRASWYEPILLDLVTSGLGVVDAAAVCHRFADFLLGYLLSEAAQLRAADGHVPWLPSRNAPAPALPHSSSSLQPLADPTWKVSLSRRQTDVDFARALGGFLRWTAGLRTSEDPATQA